MQTTLNRFGLNIKIESLKLALISFMSKVGI
jgi:hypothetical protein